MINDFGLLGGFKVDIEWAIRIVILHKEKLSSREGRGILHQELVIELRFKCNQALLTLWCLGTPFFIRKNNFYFDTQVYTHLLQSFLKGERLRWSLVLKERAITLELNIYEESIPIATATQEFGNSCSIRPQGIMPPPPLQWQSRSYLCCFLGDFPCFTFCSEHPTCNFVELAIFNDANIFIIITLKMSTSLPGLNKEKCLLYHSV